MRQKSRKLKEEIEPTPTTKGQESDVSGRAEVVVDKQRPTEVLPYLEFRLFIAPYSPPSPDWNPAIVPLFSPPMTEYGDANRPAPSRVSLPPAPVVSNGAAPRQPNIRRSARASVPSKLALEAMSTSDSTISTTPSAKALGKRPERGGSSNELGNRDPRHPVSRGKNEKKSEKATEINVDESKRRVMPMRSRRGGPGVGSSAVDTMILESQQRSAENKYIIPPETMFLITTDSKLARPIEAAAFSTTVNQETYFDQPEVVAAYKRQQVIQTPEFSRLEEGSSVGSRLRTRPAVEDFADTSDAAYIRRHRKYETLEKRQRLREKERLEYEHFKLRERIDELKSMDASAFSAVEGQDAEESKRLMLQEAEELDKRYAVLLPDSRKAMKKIVPEEDRAGSAPVSEIGFGSGPSIRLRLKRGKSALMAAALAEPPRQDSEEVEHLVTTQSELVIGDDPVNGAPHLPAEEENGSPADYAESGGGHSEHEVQGPELAPDDQVTLISETEAGHPPPQLVAEPPVRKRIRLISGPAPAVTPPVRRTREHATSYSSSKRSHTVPIIVQTAMASRPSAKRQVAPRNVLPFGVKMPGWTATETDFELPDWLGLDLDGVEEPSAMPDNT